MFAIDQEMYQMDIVLESLANELFLDLFEYLSSIDLIQAFYNQNTRLNDLIFVHFQRHSLNFQSTSKSDFQQICENYLPSISNRICGLRLSDDDDTPKQMNLFFTYKFSLEQFSHLQYLSICRIYSSQVQQKMIQQLPLLLQLRYLRITRYKTAYDERYDLGILNRIGRLSKLIYCHLDITTDNNRCLLIPSISSSSLQILSLPHLSCTIHQLEHLLIDVTTLQSLNISIVDHSMTLTTLSIQFLTIKKLNIIFYGSLSSIKNLLQSMVNLKELKMNMPSTYIDGQQWEMLIEKYLRYLTIFHLKMSISVPHQKKPEENIDDILNSFRSQFWIEKHRWFIQCYWTVTEGSSIISIYTLPYAFRHFLYIGNGQLKSTCSNDSQRWSFDRVHSLYSGYISSSNISSSAIRLKYIRHLDLTIPFDNCFSSIISTLDQLISLNIVLNNEMNIKDVQWKLQVLIDRAPHLRSLTYFSWSNENIFPFELRHSSIRQLDLRSPDLFYNYLQCIELSRSTIGQQCQVLLINIEQPTNIIYLINHMKNLRALNVQCSRTLSMLDKQEKNLVQWLEQQLPSTCSISNPTSADEDIRIWIG